MLRRTCSRYLLTYGHLTATPAALLGLLNTKYPLSPAYAPAAAKFYASDSLTTSGRTARSNDRHADHDIRPQDAQISDSVPLSAEVLTRQDNAHRRGFGAKVVLPAKDVLQEVLVDHPATFKLRAYHIGKCVHIGQVAKRAKALGCRTNSGKDYCIIWLDPAPHSSLASNQHSSNSQPHKSRQQPSKQTAYPAFIAWAHLWAKLGRMEEMQLPTVLQRKDGRLGISLRRPRPGALQAESSKPRDMNESSGVPCMLVVYRYGSVVFAGTSMWAEPWLMEEYVPHHVRYIAGGHGNTWAMRDPMSEPWSTHEEQTIVVKPDATQPAVKGVDTVELRVLDVGSVRVLTSVLGQSVALKFYETSVGDALDKLSQWRARTRRAARYQQIGGIGFISGSQEQITLFKVIAASALIINEARELLEMAEPAWQYSTYHSIWSLAADDFELEKRFRALEIKLHQVEKEAKHDVKQREGRKYHKLEQSVVLLLVVSCILAVLHLSKKLMNKSSRSSSSSMSSDFSDTDAAAAGLSVDEGSIAEAENEAVQQLQLLQEQTAAAAAAAAENPEAENDNTYVYAAAAAAVQQHDPGRRFWSDRGASVAPGDDEDGDEKDTDSLVKSSKHVETQTDSSNSGSSTADSPGRRRWWIWARKVV